MGRKSIISLSVTAIVFTVFGYLVSTYLTPKMSADSSCTPGATSSPIISSFSPTSGPVGTKVTIKGKNFGNDLGKVYLGDIELPVSSIKVIVVDKPTWSDTKITVTMPGGAVSGVIKVVKSTGEEAVKGTFQVSVPIVTSFSPISGRTNTKVIIKGKNFGNDLGKVYLGDIELPVSNLRVGTAKNKMLWSDSQITVTIPADAKSGEIRVVKPTGEEAVKGTFQVQ